MNDLAFIELCFISFTILTNVITYKLMDNRRKKDLMSLWDWQSRIEHRFRELWTCRQQQG